MSGSEERPPGIVDGIIFIPAYMQGKVNVVHSRISRISKCDNPNCNEGDEYLICIGRKARMSTLRAICCETHLRWAIEKVYEEWTSLNPSRKRYYTG